MFIFYGERLFRLRLNTPLRPPYFAFGSIRAAFDDAFNVCPNLALCLQIDILHDGRADHARLSKLLCVGIFSDGDPSLSCFQPVSSSIFLPMGSFCQLFANSLLAIVNMMNMKRILIAAAAMCLVPSLAYADLYRYETKDGEIILTSEPRKGMKLIEVIRDSPSASKKSSAASSGSGKSAPSAQTVNASSNASSYDAYIRAASQQFSIPEAFIKAVIKIESNFNPRAVSRVGAMGLMQLMPGTARHMQVDDPFDPEQNIMGGTRYLRRLADRYDGDINLVLSGYHAGPGNVEKAGGIPFEKTQQYVRNVYTWYVRYREESSGKTN